MRKVIIITFGIFFFLVIFFSYLNINIGSSNLFVTQISKNIPDDIKNFLRNSIFIFNKKKQLEKSVNILNEKIDDLDFEIKELNQKIYNVAYVA